MSNLFYARDSFSASFIQLLKVQSVIMCHDHCREEASLIFWSDRGNLISFHLQAAESGIVKIKTIAARNTDILAGKTSFP